MRFSKIGYQHDGDPAAEPVEEADSPHPSLQLWRRMRTCIARIDGEITSRMRERFGISMPQFEVLKQLRKFPDGLRMGELAQLLKVSGASITAFIDQLEQSELVLRIPDRVDRRVNSVRLTNAGRHLLGEALHEYGQWVIQLMDDADLEGGAPADEVADKLPAHGGVRAIRSKSHARA